MDFLQTLNWRYATQQFDPSRKVPKEQIELLKSAVRLSPSAYGLQLYKVLIISDEGLKAKLKDAAFGQAQLSDASHIFLFCNHSRIRHEEIDHFVSYMAQVRELQPDKARSFGASIKQALGQKSKSEAKNWLQRQPYLALGNLLAACAELKIDACPMEGFNPKEFDRILNLSKQGLTACVLAAVGYRHPEDPSQWQPKVRKPLPYLFREC